MSDRIIDNSCFFLSLFLLGVLGVLAVQFFKFGLVELFVTDPVVRHSRREAIIIGLVWLAATLYCCFYSWIYGYGSPEHPLTKADVRPILGVPSWAFWGYLVPWGVCALFTIGFAGFFMVDDDLGRDHAAELQADIREGVIDAQG